MHTMAKPSLVGTVVESVSRRLEPLINRQAARDGVPFDPAVDLHTPRGAWTVGHYGVMVPDLPEPFRFFNAIVALGDASMVPIYTNAPLVRTTKDDAAFVLTGTAAVDDGFRAYSIAADCDLAADDRHLQFADQLTITRDGRQVELGAASGAFAAEMRIELTPAVSHFTRMPGIYDHLAVLGRYEGTFTSGAHSEDVSGLCTYEWARGRSVPMPLTFFTYHVLDIDRTTQVLMVEVLGVGGLVAQRTVYVRSTDGTATRHIRGYRHTVHTHADEPLATPDGRQMRMPETFTWAVSTDAGDPLIEVHGTANGDFRYGLAAGFAGSYQYTGTFRGRPINGTAYEEWIDRRPPVG